MMKKRDVVFGMISAVLGLLLAVGVQTFARPCVHADGSAAMCAPLSSWLTAEGGIIAIFAGLAMIRPHPLFQGLQAVGGLTGALTPGVLVKICASDAMRCRQVTRPTALALGVLILITALWWMILTLIDKKREAQP